MLLTASSISSAVSVNVLIFLSLCNYLEISTTIIFIIRAPKNKFFSRYCFLLKYLDSSFSFFCQPSRTQLPRFDKCRNTQIHKYKSTDKTVTDLQVLKDPDHKTVVANSHRTTDCLLQKQSKNVKIRSKSIFNNGIKAKRKADFH